MFEASIEAGPETGDPLFASWCWFLRFEPPYVGCYIGDGICPVNPQIFEGKAGPPVFLVRRCPGLKAQAATPNKSKTLTFGSGTAEIAST